MTAALCAEVLLAMWTTTYIACCFSCGRQAAAERARLWVQVRWFDVKQGVLGAPSDCMAPHHCRNTAPAATMCLQAAHDGRSIPQPLTAACPSPRCSASLTASSSASELQRSTAWMSDCRRGWRFEMQVR